MKLFHRKLIRFSSKANLGVVLMALKDTNAHGLYQDYMD